MDEQYLSEFRAFLNEDQVLTSPEDLNVYAFDGTAMLHEMPSCVILPENTDQVSRVLKIASTHSIPVVTRGTGTGLSGGSVPVPGGIVLCLVRMAQGFLT